MRTWDNNRRDRQMPEGSAKVTSAGQIQLWGHRSAANDSVGSLWKVALAWLLGSLLAPGLVLGSAGDSAQHLYLQITFDGQAFHMVSARIENAPMPGRRGASESAPPKGPWRITLRDATGDVVWKASMPDPTVLRGEFADDSTGTVKDASHTRRLPASFLLRTPVVPYGTLHFSEQIGDQAIALGSLEVRALKPQGAP